MNTKTAIQEKSKFDICVIGGGLAGRTAAIALANEGFDVAVCAPASSGKDGRTTALLMDSVNYLEKLGLWERLASNAHPLKTMRIVDGSNRLLRAPQTDFVAGEIGLDAFGYNVQNQQFMDILNENIENNDRVFEFSGAVSSVDMSGEVTSIDIETTTGLKQITAGFVVGADGRNSKLRETVNAKTRQWQYPQNAIVLDFSHQFATNFVSTEFHTETGPFTIVPRDAFMAGLVWLEEPETASEIATMKHDQLALLLERKMQSYLGKITIETPVQTFPMQGLVAERMGDENWALIGEAAHVFPPIGAQGYNLAMRDIKALASVLSRFTVQEKRGLQYDRQRQLDVNMRTRAVDALNRSLLSSFLPTHMMRGIGLHMLAKIPPLRRLVMRMGIAPDFHPQA